MIGVNLRAVVALLVGCVSVVIFVTGDIDVVDQQVSREEFSVDSFRKPSWEDSGEAAGEPLYNASEIDLESAEYDIRRETVGNLLELSSELFVKYINKNKTDLWLVEFYDSRAEASIAFEPDFRDIAQQLEGEMYVGRVDPTYFKSIGAHFGIQEIPSIRLFKDGYVWVYRGKMEVEPILEFARGGYKEAPMAYFYSEKEDEPTPLAKVKAVIVLNAHIIAEICLHYPLLVSILLGYGLFGGLPIGLILAWFILRNDAPLVPERKSHAKKTN